MFCQIKSNFTLCVDDRHLYAVILFDGKYWVMFDRDHHILGQVETDSVQFLGGALMFVWLLETWFKEHGLYPGNEVSVAFALTDQILRQAGYEPTIHVDDAHGTVNLASMNDTDLIRWTIERFHGCGFAAWAWGEDAEKLIQTAISAHRWTITVLTDDHTAKVAYWNNVSGQTFDTNSALQAGIPAYNLDWTAALALLIMIEGQLSVSQGFVPWAEVKVRAAYGDVGANLGVTQLIVNG